METYETEGILYARGWLFGVRDERGKLWSLSASLPPLNGKRVRIRVEVLEEGASVKTATTSRTPRPALRKGAWPLRRSDGDQHANRR